MDSDSEWREKAAERWGNLFARLDSQDKILAEIKSQAILTNGRVTELEKDGARNFWLIKLFGTIGLGAAAKAFL